MEERSMEERSSEELTNEVLTNEVLTKEQLKRYKKIFFLFINSNFINSKAATTREQQVSFCSIDDIIPMPLYGTAIEQEAVLEISEKIGIIKQEDKDWDNISKVTYVGEHTKIEKFKKEEGEKYLDIKNQEEVQRFILNELKNMLQTFQFVRLRRVLESYYLVLPKLDLSGGCYEDDISAIKIMAGKEDLYGRLISKESFRKEEVKIKIEEEKNRGFEVETNVELATNNEFRFSDKTLEEIEKMERAQGFNFNTTLLKMLIGLVYFTKYQLKILEKFGELDDHYLVGCRRAGKSWFFVYLAIRQLFLKNQTILYVVPNEKFFKQPMKYFERFLDTVTTYDSSIRIRRDENAIYNDSTNSVIWFISSEARHGVRSYEATLALLDEASFIPDAEALSVETMLSQVRSMRDKGLKDKDLPVGKLVGGSTINKKTPKNWFYYDVKDIEKGVMDKALAVRVSIYQCPFYTEAERTRLVRKYEHDPEGLKCELLAIFPSSNERFDLTTLLIDNDNITDTQMDTNCVLTMGKPEYFKEEMNCSPFAVIGYDPAKKSSNVGLSILEVYMNRATKKTKIVIVGEAYIPKFVPFTQQSRIIAKIYKHLGGIYRNIMVGMDNTGIGEPVSEMLSTNGILHSKIQYITSKGMNLNFNNKAYYKRDMIWYVHKSYLMDLAPALFAQNKLFSWRLPKTQSDFETYNDINNFNVNKESIDFYHSVALAIFEMNIKYPEIILEIEKMGSGEKNYDMRGLLSEVISNYTIGGTNAGIRRNNKTNTRFEKFGY